jgi:hypothetical protein
MIHWGRTLDQSILITTYSVLIWNWEWRIRREYRHSRVIRRMKIIMNSYHRIEVWKENKEIVVIKEKLCKSLNHKSISKFIKMKWMFQTKRRIRTNIKFKRILQKKRSLLSLIMKVNENQSFIEVTLNWNYHVMKTYWRQRK